MSVAHRPRVRPYPLDALPRLTRGQVGKLRELASWLPLSPGPDWDAACAALGGRPTVTSVELQAGQVHELPPRGTRLLFTATGGQRVLLLVDPRLAPRLARRALGVDDEVELRAGRELTLAEEGALEFLGAALVEGSPDGWRLDGVLPPDQPLPERALDGSDGDEGWQLLLTAQVETPVGPGWLTLASPSSLRLARRPRRGTSSALLATLPTRLRVEALRFSLSPGALGALAVEDLVLVGRRSTGSVLDGAELRVGELCVAGRIQGEHFIVAEPAARRERAERPESPQPAGEQPDPRSPPPAVEPAARGGVAPRAWSTQPLAPGENDMPQDPASPQPELVRREDGRRESLLRELPVEVVCELGHVQLSGRELLDLRPGSVLLVGRPLSGPVDLTIGGKRVGQGELVDVEGELGVRVLALEP